MSPEGLAKFGWFRTLNTSIRHSTTRDSMNGVIFDSDMSKFCWPGPLTMFRAVLPQRSPAGTKAAVLKYRFSRSSVRPDKVAVATFAPGAQLARDAVEPNKAAPLRSVMLKGVPVWAVVTPLTCQPLKNFLPKVELFIPNPQAGIAYTYDNVMRCR